MRVVIENTKTRLIVGGKDLLVDSNLMTSFRKYMSVKVPGSFFAAKALKYHWDGIKYFITPGGTMATGFLPTFLKFVEEEYPDLTVEFIDERGDMPVFKEEFINQIGDRVINEQYIHQKHVIQAYNHNIVFRGQNIYFPRGVSDAATNAGKTAIIAGIYLNLIGTHNMLVIIHLKTVYRELLAYFESIFGEIGQINDKNYKIKSVTLAMIQTLTRRIDDINVKKDISNFDILAVDESHRAGSSEYTHALVNCNAPVRVFVSGSAFDSDDIVAKMIIVGQSGPRLIKVSKKELMDKGISTPIKVKMHLCNTILRVPLLVRNDCVKIMVHESMERASLMLDIIRKRRDKGPILVAVQEIKHGEFLLNYFRKFGGVSRQSGWDPYNIELTHSKDKQIIQRVDAFKTGEIDVLISTGVLKEGVNLPLIQTIIFAAGGESGVYIRQWMGRGERIHESKTEVEFHDFYDIGRYVQLNSMHRLKIYKAENLSVDMNFDPKDLKKLSSVVINPQYTLTL
jgi:superfamily II DNA or RNA helicase